MSCFRSAAVVAAVLVFHSVFVVEGQTEAGAREVPRQLAPPEEVRSTDSGRDSTWFREGYGLSNPEPLDGTIPTDRPSFGTGTAAVPIGRFQVELGYTYADGPGEETHSFPNTLIRFGVLDGVELRFSTAGQIWREENSRDGLDDISLGAKIEVRDQQGYLPKLAVQPSFRIPLDGARESDEVDPRVEFAVSWSLAEDWSLLVNANTGAVSVDDDTESVFESSVLLGHSLTDEIGVFAEYFAIYPGDGSDAQNLDAGVLYLLNDNVQLDASIGFGLNDAANDLVIGAGFAFRL